MLKADTYGDALDVFTRAVIQENDNLNAGINKPVYFEAQIKKILVCDFGSSERFSVENLHDAAMGFHSVLPKTEKEIDELRKHKETMNRTPEEMSLTTSSPNSKR